MVLSWVIDIVFFIMVKRMAQRDRHKNKHTDIVTYRLNQSRVRFSKKYQNLATVKYEVSAASTEQKKIQ